LVINGDRHQRGSDVTDLYRPKGLSSAVCYQDAKAAYRWLEEAFGFEPLFVILDADDNLGHSEMTFGNSVVMVGNEWSADHRSPKSAGGKNTQTVHVQLAEGEDIDAHCERAREAGAENWVKGCHTAKDSKGNEFFCHQKKHEKDGDGLCGTDASYHYGENLSYGIPSRSGLECH
jgi:uncharacterized glyoxalase superfamily protein PhnB